LALELAPRNILVNAIAPVLSIPPMSVVNGVNELHTDWFRNNYIEGQPPAAETRGATGGDRRRRAFLTGPDATFLTGQVIVSMAA